MDGFRIVREWVWFLCDGLQHSSSPPDLVYNEYFTPQFMVGCTLAFDLDRENAMDYVPRTRMYRWNLWPRSLVREGGHFVVREFVTFARGEAYNSLNLGSLFLRYVWQRRDPPNSSPIYPQSSPSEEAARGAESSVRSCRKAVGVVHYGLQSSLPGCGTQCDLAP